MAALEERTHAVFHQTALHLITVKLDALFRQFRPALLQTRAEHVQMIMRQRNILKLPAVIMTAETAVELFLKNTDRMFKIGNPLFHV